MSVYRTDKEKGNFAVVSTEYLKDKALSLRAKGLLTIMLSLPENWEYSINGLAALTDNGVKAIRNTLSELKARGYLEMIEARTPQGKLCYTYDIFENGKKRRSLKEKAEILLKEKQKAQRGFSTEYSKGKRTLKALSTDTSQKEAIHQEIYTPDTKKANVVDIEFTENGAIIDVPDFAERLVNSIDESTDFEMLDSLIDEYCDYRVEMDKC